jgi:hypothetical protein
MLKSLYSRLDHSNKQVYVMSDSTVSADHYNALKLERDELAAKLDRMTRVLKDCAPNLQSKDELYGLKWAICDVLNETPAQSLTEVRAAELDRFGNKQLDICNTNTGQATQDYYQSVAEDAFQEAADIRQEALSDD